MSSEAVKERNMELALATAFELFLKNGIENTTKEMLVRASGLSRSSVDRYFPTKLSCVLAVAQWAGRNYREKSVPLQSIFADGAKSGAAMLKEYFKAVQALLYEKPDLFVLGVECRAFIYRNASQDKDAEEAIYHALGPSALLKKILERGLADGSITVAIDPEVEAVVVRESLIGFLASMALSYTKATTGDRSLVEYFINRVLIRYGI